MATSGLVKTNETYDSHFWVKWSQVGDQDIANNRTQISWSCGLTSSHKFYSNAVKMSAFYINGTMVYGGGTYSNFTAEGEQQIASGTLWISHDSDGTKTFSISSFTGWLYSNHNYSSSGDDFTLTAIPRQATITAAPNFTDLDNPTISYSNPAGNAVTSVEACISLTGALDDIAYRAISKTGSTYTFPLTDTERNVLRNATVNTRTVYFYVRTYIGSVRYLSSVARTLTIAESQYTKPSVSMSVTLNNSSLPSAFSGLYIQGKSKVNVSLSATGKYNATISSYSASIDGKSYSGSQITSDAIQNSGSRKIVGYAKDSRGFTGSTEQTISVVEYSKPLVIPVGSENSILCYRSDGNGKRVGNSTSVWVKAKRSYYSVSGKNKCALQWRRKLATAAWNDSQHTWSNLIASTATTTNEYNALIPSAVFDLKNAYTIQIRAIDDIGEYDIKTLEVPTQDVALHLGAGGKNVAIGTYCDTSDPYTFYSKWKAKFDSDVYIGGTKVSNHVVDEGTSSPWKYRKWNNGIVELWCSTTTTYANSNVMTKDLAYPFTIVETICGIGTLNSYGGNLAASLHWNLKIATESDKCIVLVHNTAGGFTTTSTIYASVYIVGRWK